MRISELERESGVPRSRIHYYLREGILHPPHKAGKTSALYDESHLERLESIQRIKMEYLASKKKFRMSAKELKRKLEQAERTFDEAGDEGDFNEIEGMKRDIVEAALRLYSERGYYHTNLDDIAREADIGASDLYLYFTDKREIFVESIEYALQIINRDVRESIANEENWTNIILDMLEIYIQRYPKVGDMINQLRVGVAIDDRWARDLLIRLYRDISKDISRTLQSLMDRGIIKTTDADLLAFILAFTGEAIYQRASFDKQHSAEEIGRQVADWFYNGIAPINNDVGTQSS